MSTDQAVTDVTKVSIYMPPAAPRMGYTGFWDTGRLILVLVAINVFTAGLGGAMAVWALLRMGGF